MRGRRTYKFTDKHHSGNGIRSTLAGAVSLGCTLGAVYGAYVAKGNAGTYLAFLGVVAIIGCIYGVYVGNLSFKEEDVYYLFPRIGTVLNLILLIFWIAVAGMGCLLS